MIDVVLLVVEGEFRQGDGRAVRLVPAVGEGVHGTLEMFVVVRRDGREHFVHRFGLERHDKVLRRVLNLQANLLDWNLVGINDSASVVCFINYEGLRHILV